MNVKYFSYKKKVLLLIVVLSILRLILSFVIELGNDESYYWLYSQHIKLNYFDHPPMIAFWIRATTLNLWLENYPACIRLGSIISCAGATWFMFKCTSALSNERAGWFAACLYNAFFYTSVTAGIFAFPDAPQMLFFTWSLFLLVRITQNETKEKYWLMFGVITGLCIMSKVHGLFIWFGLGCYILFYKRNWLKNIHLYAALTISIIICLPILFWNIHYDFATWKFNAPRISIEHTALNWNYFFNEIYSEIFRNNPLNYLFIVLALIALAKYRLQRLAALTIFNFIGLTFIATLLVISLFKETLAHWCGPALVALLPVAAIYLETKTKGLLWTRLSLIMHICVLIFCAWFINYYPGNFGVPSGRFLGLNDKSLDMFGWKEAGKKFDSLYVTYQQKKLIPANTPVVTNGWWGAHIEYYYCRPLNLKMIGVGDVMNLHEYAWMNNLRKNSVNMQQAFCIVQSDGFYNIQKAYKNYYAHIDSIATIPVYRSNKPAHNFYIYHLSGWKGTLPLE